jgi:hypothetical protein
MPCIVVIQERRIWPPSNGTLSVQEASLLSCSCDSLATITHAWSTDDTHWGLCQSNTDGISVLPPPHQSGLFALCDFVRNPADVHENLYMTPLVEHLKVSTNQPTRPTNKTNQQDQPTVANTTWPLNALDNAEYWIHRR